jgi:hypothetical protein
MSNMSDYEAGQLVAVVTQLNGEIHEMNKTCSMLSDRVNELERQMARGKGMFAGAIMISMGLGGVGSTLFSRWFN